MRRLTFALTIPVLILLPTYLRADWPAGGVRVSDPYADQMQPQVATDGAGGALVVWHNRPDGSKDDGYIQRLTSSGAFAPGWTAAGTAFVVAAGHQGGFFLLPDSVGGTYIAWSDTRDLGSTDYDAYIQRVTGEGQIAPGWPDDGLPICTVRLLQALPVMAADGQGGVFVVWEDERAASGTRDIYAQHVRKEGTLFEGWPDQGLPLSTAPEQQAGPSVVPDGELGAIVGWSDGRNGRRSSYAVRIDAGGALLPGWVSDGTLVSFTGFGAMLVPDGEGGAFVGMLDDRTRPPGRIDYPYIDIYVQRVRGDGTIAPDWPADGAPVCTATQLQQAHQIAPDLTGGVFLAWEDYRAGSGDAYVQRIMPDGSIAPGWPVNGLRVSTWSGYEGLPHLAPDGAGGCYVIYEDFSNYRVYCQHVSGAGDLRWGANGLLVSPLPTYGQQYASIAADSRGVAIVAWEETRTNGSDYDVYAQRIGLDGPTAVLISLVETETEADRVRLTWHGPEAAGLVATVYRRSESEDWRSLAELIADGSGRLASNRQKLTLLRRVARRSVRTAFGSGGWGPGSAPRVPPGG